MSQGGNYRDDVDDDRKIYDSGAPSLLGLFDPPPLPSSSLPGSHKPTIEEKKSLEEEVTGETEKGGALRGGQNQDDDFEFPDSNGSNGSLSHMMRLFAPPQAASVPSSANTAKLPSPTRPPISRPQTISDRQSTERRSNRSQTTLFVPSLANSENAPLLDSSFATPGTSGATSGWHTPQSSFDATSIPSSWRENLFASPTTPLITNQEVVSSASATLLAPHQLHLPPTNHARKPSVALPAILERVPQTHLPIDQPPRDDGDIDDGNADMNKQTMLSNLTALSIRSSKSTIQSLRLPTTYIGSFMYLLYHVVFCLALGSAITRPHSPTDTSILGIMTKTAALGTIAASSVYWFSLSSEVPALYPTADLFLAPFLANLALIVDQTLSDDMISSDSSADGAAALIVTKENYDGIFLATFGVLTMIGFLLSSGLLVAASVFKLANLGSFLPFPVICGFFAAVGILTWTLALNVDTGGKSIGVILTSGHLDLWKFALVHHIPTLVVAGFMKYLGPKNPFFVVGVVFVTFALFHITMLVSGTTMEEMIEMGWFWSHDELVYVRSTVTVGFDKWAPPAPFGVLAELRHVHWGAVQNGLSTAVALSFLYLIRCSVHGAALKKNIPNLARKVRSDDPALKRFSIDDDESVSPKHKMNPPKVKSRTFSEAVDIEAVMQAGSGVNEVAVEKPEYEMLHAKPSNVSLKSISLTYGYSQVVSALVGGFAVTPAVAASTTMFSLGAEGLGPQIGSVLLLLVFYVTDFQFVVFIPKPAFSSMLVLSSVDMMWNWFYKSYFKTKDKAEWMVVPAIVVVAFAVDLLSAVFIGIAFSTFIFVAAFFRSGVVKYVATGQLIHSTIERTFRMSEWLNEKGDLIGIMVLQNYLFFGNASSVYGYICSMFNDNDKQSSLERKPKYLILDLTLVTGMDTSTADIFQDIRNLCGSNKCKLLMAGMSPNIRSILALGGFKADAGVRSKRKLRFFQNLDAALGKAEDMLLDSEYDDREHQPAVLDGRRRLRGRGNTGFRTALGYIDAEHRENFSFELVALEEYTKLVELNPGDRLYEDGQSKNLERGLFFIECGVLKVEHDASGTATRGSMSSMRSFRGDYQSLMATDTLRRIHARCLVNTTASDTQMFRVARIGVGWIAGTLEAVSGMQLQGEQVAVDYCRLHHLPFSKIQQVEKENPTLALTLYKLLSYLMARRQEATIGQLATLHSIMSSPARWRSYGRSRSHFE